MINIGLVMLPVKSGPKLAVCCLIIVALFMELRGAYRSRVDFNVIILVVSYKEMGRGLLWGELTSQGTM